jgi:Alpha/beta hydrolase of unknown function (DUF900)
MEASAKETIIIVHGTWAAPKAGARRWYEPVGGGPAAEGFVSKLDAALQKRGSSARCWAHCSQGNQIFHWSGDNSWIARTRAASALADYVAKLRNDGWRCHIVAHSHGGNVVVEALEQIITAPSSNKAGIKFVTLGTPFIDTTSPILRSAKSRYRILNLASWGAFALLVLLLISWLLGYFDVSTHLATWFFLNCLALLSEGICENIDIQLRVFIFPLHGAPPWVGLTILSLILLFLVFRRIKRHSDLPGFGASTGGAAQAEPQLLVMGSLVDEAWQILHHMRSMPDQLAVRLNVFVYLWSSLRSSALQSGEVARIHGARSFRDLAMTAKVVMLVIYLFCFFVFSVSIAMIITEPMDKFTFLTFGLLIVTFFVVLLVFTTVFGESFFSAFLSPFRWSAQRLGSFASLFPAIGTYVVRRMGWSVLLAMTMGLEGYRFAMPAIEQFPKNVPESFVKYENIPTGAEQRALSMRSAWVARHLGDVSQTFSRMAVTAADISLLLQTVEEDQTLVHAAYYTYDECIDRIADWIADMG